VACSFGFGVVAARFLGAPELFAQIVLLVTTVDLLLVLIGLGIPDVLVRYGHQAVRYGWLKKYLLGSVLACLSCFTTILLIWYSLSNSAGSLLGLDSFVWTVALLIIPLRWVTRVSFSILWSTGRFIQRGLVDTLAPFFRLLVMLGMVTVLPSDALGLSPLTAVAAIYGLSEVFSAVISVLMLRFVSSRDHMRDHIDQEPEFEEETALELMKKFLPYAFWGVCAAFFLVLISFSDRVMVQSAATKEVLGEFGVAYSLVNYYYVASVIVSNVLLTNQVKLWSVGQAQSVIRNISLLSIVTAIGSVGLYFILDAAGVWIIAVTYGEAFVGGVAFFKALCFCIGMQCVYAVVGVLCPITEKPWITALGLGLGVLFNYVASLTASAIFGAIGVIVATGFAYGLVIVFIVWMLRCNGILIPWVPVIFSLIVVATPLLSMV